MPHTPPDLSRMSGQRLADRYELVVRRGSGGMANVWEGVDHNLGRRIAVKVLHPHLAATESILNRFRSEAHAAARLTHPGIVAIYDTVTTEDTDAIIMELVEGNDLRTLLDERPTLELVDAVEVCVQLAAALGHAHQHGIIHRDVKPANILVRPDRRVKLSDFGIAKALDQTGHTESGSLVGTVKYLAPEQLEGTGVDARTDLYALTTVFYEMLCGEVPFAANDLVTAMSRVRTDPPSVRDKRPDLSPGLEAFIRRGLARQPSDRYADAATWSAALTASVRGDSTMLDTPTPAPRAPTITESIPQRQAPPTPTPAQAAPPIVGPGPAPSRPTMPGPRPSGARSPKRAPAKADPVVAKHHERNRSRLAFVGPVIAVVLMIAAVVTVWLLLSGGTTTVDSADDPNAAESETDVVTESTVEPTTPTTEDQAVEVDEAADTPAVTAAPVTTDSGSVSTEEDTTTTSTETTSTTTTEAPDFAAGQRAVAIDPFGDDTERGESSMFALDGNPDTYWRTESYITREFGNLKPGVGLVLEFENPVPITAIEILADRVDWSVEIFSADTASFEFEDWGEPIGAFDGLTESAVLDVPDLPETSAVLLWVTDLGLAPEQTAEEYDAQVEERAPEQRLEISEIVLVG